MARRVRMFQNQSCAVAIATHPFHSNDPCQGATLGPFLETHESAPCGAQRVTFLGHCELCGVGCPPLQYPPKMRGLDSIPYRPCFARLWHRPKDQLTTVFHDPQRSHRLAVNLDSRPIANTHGGRCACSLEHPLGIGSFCKPLRPHGKAYFHSFGSPRPSS